MSSNWGFEWVSQDTYQIACHGVQVAIVEISEVEMPPELLGTISPQKIAEFIVKACNHLDTAIREYDKGNEASLVLQELHRVEEPNPVNELMDLIEEFGDSNAALANAYDWGGYHKKHVAEISRLRKQIRQRLEHLRSSR